MEFPLVLLSLKIHSLELPWPWEAASVLAEGHITRESDAVAAGVRRGRAALGDVGLPCTGLCASDEEPRHPVLKSWSY